MMKFFLVFLLFTASAFAGGSEIETFHQALSTTAAQVSDFDARRQSILIRNLDASISVYVGKSTVTSSSTTGGMLVKAGEYITITNSAPIYAIAASGTPNIAVFIEKN